MHLGYDDRTAPLKRLFELQRHSFRASDVAKGLLEISSLSWYLESKSDNLLEVLKESFIFHTPLGS